MNNTRHYFHIILIACLVFILVVPLATFALMNHWPSGTLMAYLFWTSFAAMPLFIIVWLVYDHFSRSKKPSEPTLAFLQLLSCVLLMLLPPFNWIFTFPQLGLENNQILFVVLLLLNLLVFLFFLAINLYLLYADRHISQLREQSKAESCEVVTSDKAYENEDGSFKGSRLMSRYEKKQDEKKDPLEK
jgi:bacteriorhodopsin